MARLDGEADHAAAALLARLLHREGARRPSSAEALQHNYFAAAGRQEHEAARQAQQLARARQAELRAAEAEAEKAAARRAAEAVADRMALEAEEQRLGREREQMDAALSDRAAALARERAAVSVAGQQALEERLRLDDLSRTLERERAEAARKLAAEEGRLAAERARIEARIVHEDRVAAGRREELAKLAEQLAAKERELAFNLQLRPPPYWTGRAGFMSVLDTGALHRLQSWMQETAVHPEGCGAAPRPLTGLRVTRVMRVENQDLWHLYSYRREVVRSNMPAGGSVPRIDGLVRKPAWAVETGSPTGPGSPLQGGVNELWLFHGTSEEAMHAIVHDGFDARIAKVEGLYGAGSYFADCSCKSHQYASQYTTPAGERVVLACRVTMGWPYLPDGQLKNCRRPPSNPGAGPSRIFDSVFAQAGKANSGQQKHHECVVYDTNQAYPEYVIYYTC